MGSISGKASLIRQVSFPKVVLPVVAVFSDTFVMLPGFVLVIRAAWFLEKCCLHQFSLYTQVGAMYEVLVTNTPKIALVM